MADNQTSTSDALVARIQQMALDEPRDMRENTQPSPDNQTLPAHGNDTERDNAMRDSPSSQEEAPQKMTEDTAAPVRNIQHLIHRRERRTRRIHLEASTSTSPPAKDSTSRPRPDYAARNRELQSRPRRVVRYSAWRNETRARPASYTSILHDMTSQIINDMVERPSEIDRYFRKYHHWFRLNFPRDSEHWHQYKAEWCTWQHFYKNHIKHNHFPGVEPGVARAYTRKEREEVYANERLRQAMKKAHI